MRLRILTLAGVLAVLFSLFWWYSHDTIEELVVGGPIEYSITETNQIIADTLPPPLHIIEPYYAVFRSLGATDLGPEADPGDRSDYNTLTYWKKYFEDRINMPGGYMDRHRLWIGDERNQELKAEEDPRITQYLDLIQNLLEQDRKDFPVRRAEEITKWRYQNPFAPYMDGISETKGIKIDRDLDGRLKQALIQDAYAYAEQFFAEARMKFFPVMERYLTTRDPKALEDARKLVHGPMALLYQKHREETEVVVALAAARADAYAWYARDVAQSHATRSTIMAVLALIVLSVLSSLFAFKKTAIVALRRPPSLLLRTATLVGVFALAVIVHGLLSYRTLELLRVGGPIEQAITESRYVIADVNAPAKNVIDAYYAVIRSVPTTELGDEVGSHDNTLNYWKSRFEDSLNRPGGFMDRHRLWIGDERNLELRPEEDPRVTSYLERIQNLMEQDRQDFPVRRAEDITEWRYQNQCVPYMDKIFRERGIKIDRDLNKKLRTALIADSFAHAEVFFMIYRGEIYPAMANYCRTKDMKYLEEARGKTYGKLAVTFEKHLGDIEVVVALAAARGDAYTFYARDEIQRRYTLWLLMGVGGFAVAGVAGLILAFVGRKERRERCLVCATIYSDQDPTCPQCGTAKGTAPAPRPPPPDPEPSPKAMADFLAESVPSHERPTVSEQAEVLPDGTRLGSYEILDLIGRGGMGTVYRARHTMLDRIVALKVLPEALTSDPKFVQRFKREAQLLARLHHPNIVAIYDMGQDGDRFYFAMELIDGTNLRSVLNSGGLSPQEALHLVPKLCDALEYAHRLGIVHRDIKPENILLASDGEPRIADFGLARIVRGEGSPLSLTMTHAVMGTVDYMAPEQRRSTKDVDHRADIFSMGVVLYEMLTGQLPIGRFDPPTRKVAVDVKIDEVVLKALEYDRERRYSHAAEMGTEIRSVPPPPSPPPEPAEGAQEPRAP